MILICTTYLRPPPPPPHCKQNYRYTIQVSFTTTSIVANYASTTHTISHKTLYCKQINIFIISISNAYVSTPTFKEHHPQSGMPQCMPFHKFVESVKNYGSPQLFLIPTKKFKQKLLGAPITVHSFKKQAVGDFSWNARSTITHPNSNSESPVSSTHMKVFQPFNNGSTVPLSSTIMDPIRTGHRGHTHQGRGTGPSRHLSNLDRNHHNHSSHSPQNHQNHPCRRIAQSHHRLDLGCRTSHCMWLSP